MVTRLLRGAYLSTVALLVGTATGSLLRGLVDANLHIRGTS